MRIAILAHAGSVHTIRWCQGLSARGHLLQLISRSRPEPFAPDVPIDYLSGRTPLSYVFSIPRVRHILTEFRPDIVHAHYATGYGLWGSAQETAPLVLSLWGSDIEDALVKRLTVAPIVRRALRKARFVTASSQYLLDRAAAFEPSIRSHMRHIPFGVSIAAPFCPKPDTSDAAIIHLIFAKSCHPSYAPDLVIKAFAEALRIFPRLHLTMLGGGPLKNEMERLAKTLEISRAVTFHDRVELQESIRLIGQSDIMVMPSVKEGFGVAAVEAAAAGIPVIATRVGGIPEIVADGISGILIPPGDRPALAAAIVRLASAPDLRRAMGLAGRKIAEERFNFDACLEAMEKVYHEVLCQA